MVHADDSWERYTVTVRDDELVSVSPYSGDDAYAQNETDDYTSAEELWCFIGCEACQEEEEQEVYQESGNYVAAASSMDGICPEE